MTALKNASASPSASWPVVLCGNDPRFLSVVPDRSTREIMMIPTSEAITPMSFRRLNISTPIQAPTKRVQMPIEGVLERRKYLRVYRGVGGYILLVEPRTVELATVVYCRHAAME